MVGRSVGLLVAGRRGKAAAALPLWGGHGARRRVWGRRAPAKGAVGAWSLAAPTSIRSGWGIRCRGAPSSGACCSPVRVCSSPSSGPLGGLAGRVVQAKQPASQSGSSQAAEPVKPVKNLQPRTALLADSHQPRSRKWASCLRAAPGLGPGTGVPWSVWKMRTLFLELMLSWARAYTERFLTMAK